MMSDRTELHDSWVEMGVSGNKVLLLLRPAYIHHWDHSTDGWRGEERSQSAEIVILRGRLSSTPDAGTGKISGGWFEIGGRLHENLIPVALEYYAVARGRHDLLDADGIERA